MAAPKAKPKLGSLDEVDPEILRIYEKLGIPLEEALKSMVNRVPNMDLNFFVTAVAIQRQTGGDLKTVVNWCKMKKEADPLPKEARENELSTARYKPVSTVNIINPNNNQQHPVRVHLPLITIFNEKIVIN